MSNDTQTHLPIEAYRIGQRVAMLNNEGGVFGEAKIRVLNNENKRAIPNTRAFIEVEFIDPALDWHDPIFYDLSAIKPVLRRMEDMTDEEQNKHNSLCQQKCYIDNRQQSICFFSETGLSIDYLDSIGVDCMGWIPAGLAVDAKTLVI